MAWGPSNTKFSYLGVALPFLLKLCALRKFTHSEIQSL